jgi:hemolysin-activating ACP:hemolysin acyltransferase
MDSRRDGALATHQKNDEEQRRIQCALVCSPLYAQAPPSQLESLAEACQSLCQYRVYGISLDVPTGILSWAWLSDFTLIRLNENPFALLHPSEWNEGTMLCFRDIVPTTDSANAIADDLGGALFPGEPCYVTMQTDSKGTLSLIRFEPDERYELSEWVRAQYSPNDVAR